MPVRARDFFTDAKGDRRLDVGLLEELRRGPLRDSSDVDVAIALLRLVRKNLEHVARSGSPKNIKADDDIALALKVLRAVLGRIGVELPYLPFRDYTSLQLAFLRQGWGSVILYDEERLVWVGDMLEPVAARLANLEEEEFQRTLAEPVSSPVGPWWRDVDDEIAGLRRSFASASTAQQYSNLGNSCVRILEAVGEAVHDPAQHLQPGESPLARDKVKERITRFHRCSTSGFGQCRAASPWSRGRRVGAPAEASP